MKHYSEYRTKHTWTDAALALLMALLLFFLAFLTLDSGNRFSSDDYAAYMLSGFSIAEGTFDQQNRINRIFHPTAMPLEAAESEKLVYPWGYPLLLAPIYRLAGFDRTDYHSIVYYTLPGAAAFAAAGGLLFLFYRRRMGTVCSFVLALLCCLSQQLFSLVGNIQTDVVFMAMCMLIYWLTEVFLARPERRIPLGILLGAAMWFTYALRLNGFTICLLTGLAHLIFALRSRKEDEKPPFWQQLLPYAVFGVLTLVFDHLIFSPATPNTSDFVRITGAQVLKNAGSYWKMIREWLGALWFAGPLEGLNGLPVVLLTLALMAVGIAAHGLRHNLHLTLLLIGTFAALLFLPYTQGVRYFINVMPLVLLFAALGLQWLWGLISRRWKPGAGRGIAAAFCGLMLICGACTLLDTGAEALEQYRHRGDPKPATDAYTDDAISMYHYIMENTAEDCTIAFLKSRCLYLNTQRLAFNPAVNDHSIDDADYFLVFNKRGQGGLMEGKDYFEAVYGNDLLTLYANRQRVAQ